MRILISNDDGIDASGLDVLFRAARHISDDVWIVAPDGNRSGFGHGISLRRGFGIRKVADRRYSCTGTPADCVIAAATWLFSPEEKPDFVLSGINEGRNVAEDVSYSGTMAVAREAALIGIPSIALSMPRDSEDPAPRAVEWLGERLGAFWAGRQEWAQEGHWLNVNLPRRLPAPVRAARIGRDKVATRIVIHKQDEVSAWIEPLADRNYTSLAGDENSLIDAGCVSVTCLNWHGHAVVPESGLHELELSSVEIA